MNIPRCLQAVRVRSANYIRSGLIGVFALLSTMVSTNVSALSIGNYETVNVVRLSRVVYEMTFKAHLINDSDTMYSNALATLTPTVSNISVVDGDLHFGYLGVYSSTLSSDTFTIRVDRSVPTPPLETALSWSIDAAVKPPPVPTPNPSAAGIFMKVEGPDIKGESTVSSHEKWIELISVSEGLSQSGSFTAGSTGGAGKANFQDVSISKYLGISSVPLRMALANGEHIGKVVIEIVKRCDTGFYTEYAIEMENLIVSSVAEASDSGGVRPIENITLNFGKIFWTYVTLGNSCNNKQEWYSGWDVAANKAQ